MAWLIAASLAWACFAATAMATFVPIGNPGSIEYWYVWPGPGPLLTAIAAGVAGLTAIFTAARLVLRRVSPGAAAGVRSGRWLAPMCACGPVALGLLPAVPGVGERGAVLGFLFYDLRWWWLAGAVGLTAWRLQTIAGDPVRQLFRAVARLPDAPRRLLLDVALFVAVIAWAWTSLPALRFDPNITGDEPKYLRYCEVWYQGQGLTISTKALIDDLPLDVPSHVLRNVALTSGAVLEEARALASDLRRAAVDPFGFQWNRAQGSGGFITGKRGGVYETHQPGLSVVLFPGYFLDRHFLDLATGYQGEFPATLMMTRLSMLLIYGLCAVALFRLLRHALEHEGLAWAWAVIGMATLPTTAFALQLYPELPAALVVLIVGNFVWFHAGSSGRLAASAAGVAAGALSWFHPRFVLVSVCLAAVGVVRTQGRARRAFGAAFVVAALTLAAYDYRVTGSALPNALWSTPDAPPVLEGARLGPNLLGYAFDRAWGLVPHSLMLLGVLPGLVVLARRTAARAAWVAAMALALLVPAAGHSLSAAQTTPGRLVLAIVPLLIWPIAVLVRRFWASSWMRAAATIAVLLSLQTALAYNIHLARGFEALRAPGASGWRPNVAFPAVRSSAVLISDGSRTWLLWSLVAAVSLATLVAWRRSRSASPRPGRSRSPWLAPAAVAILVVAATVATAATGAWTRNEYQMDGATARRAAALALVKQDRCRLCFTSHTSQVDWTALQPNPVRGLNVTLGFDHLTITAALSLDSGGLTGGFARVGLDYGDDSGIAWIGVLDPVSVKHTYARPGRYRIDAWLLLPNGERRVSRYPLTVD